ncbi:diacylglycerol/lipid kinase family protein [Emticicia sp. 17c]|uniref:diacylglycerol/lipid kinase family protein n=1 Tax=Emticicia sp. 17c TaxID=3127704 RepID=UPI00301D7B81
MPKKILLLINPYSGSGKSLAASDYLRQHLQGYEYTSVISQYKGHLSDFLQNTDLSLFEKIVVLGGDGTMHEITNAIGTQINLPPVMLFPCGSGNAFNHDIDSLDWATSLQKLQEGSSKDIDIFRMFFSDTQPIYGFNVMGWGLVSAINQSAEKLRWLGTARYTIAALIHLFRNPVFKGNVQVDGELFTGNFSFVLACNTQHTGKSMKIAPLALLDDGLLDVLVIKHVRFYHLLRLFPLIFSGKHIHSSLVIYRKAKQIRIDANPSVLVVDGEIKCQTPLTIEVMANKLRMIV